MSGTVPMTMYFVRITRHQHTRVPRSSSSSPKTPHSTSTNPSTSTSPTSSTSRATSSTRPHNTPLSPAPFLTRFLTRNSACLRTISTLCRTTRRSYLQNTATPSRGTGATICRCSLRDRDRSLKTVYNS